MGMQTPKFLSSKYFVPEPNNWHLKEDAPEEIVKEFEEFMKAHTYQKRPPRATVIEFTEEDMKR